MNCERLEAHLDELLRARAGEFASPAAKACEEHLLACAACSALVRALSEPLAEAPDFVPFARAVALSERVLPRLAQLDPGPEFTLAVLRRTRAEQRRRRLAQWWRRQLERPQFATEFAYGFTLALVLLVGTPYSPGAAWPSQLLTWLQRSDEASADWLSASVLPVATAPARFLGASGEVGAQLTAEVDARSASVSAVLDRVGGHTQHFARGVWERDWEALRPLLQELHCDMRLLWGAARGAVENVTDDLRC